MFYCMFFLFLVMSSNDFIIFFIVGKGVVKIQVIDCDLGENGCVIYFIILGNLDGYFSLNFSIGELIILKSFDLEFV